VDTAAVNGVAYAKEQFREWVAGQKHREPERLWPQTHGTKPPPIFAALQSPVPWSPVVESLHAAATLSNWDQDAAVDGYTLWVAPLAGGVLLPVEGVVSTTLYGYRWRPGDATEKWEPLDRWSQPLTLACYGPSGGLLRLPCLTQSTDGVPAVSPRRRLRVELQAPGHGTFEADIPLLAEKILP
jgi:hypothetical protein